MFTDYPTSTSPPRHGDVDATLSQTNTNPSIAKLDDVMVKLCEFGNNPPPPLHDSGCRPLAVINFVNLKICTDDVCGFVLIFSGVIESCSN